MTTQVPIPTGEDVLRFLGWEDDPDTVERANVHANNVLQAALAHTRGVGFVSQPTSSAGWTCAAPIAAVITSAAARSLNNPTASVRQEAGQWSEVFGAFGSWSLVERATLDGYRRQVA